ncbi:Oidioi.mRNA.OKI2018_I69.XSR.g13368.t1.cds [Oikopleura dioica]|uniref:Oidioi.mRNA.OKI2018_I69.XSR.g13368.t1.cds n=1 Tax=Oikopleura dioica TaxID=34765 RepID=A0ABN7SF24_OIKDI|nr:Oidioi.mRNA.OKI2018_I69.XSR.g13368.t1.cds [Oikopleura dioica]
MLTVKENEKAYQELFEAFGVFETIEKDLIKKRPRHHHHHRHTPPEGSISRSFLIQALKSHGEPFSEEELSHFVKTMDISGSDEAHFHYAFFVESITGRAMALEHEEDSDDSD